MKVFVGVSLITVVLLLVLLLVAVIFLYIRIAHADPDVKTLEVLHSFKVCGKCETFKRFGEVGDGGYLMCMDNLDRGNIKAAYSFGVERHDQWSIDLYNLLKVPVYQFDCTVSKQAQECPACRFFPVCLQAESGAGGLRGKTSWSLGRILNETGSKDAIPKSLVMKVDIEASEWPVFMETPGSVLSLFQQVVVEFHWLNKRRNHAQYFKAMDKLLGVGFQVVHVHGNNFRSSYFAGSYSIPEVVEVTLTSTGQRLEECHDPRELPLDMDNGGHWGRFTPHLP